MCALFAVDALTVLAVVDMKKKTIRARVTEEEHALITEAACDNNMTVNEYVIHCCLLYIEDSHQRTSQMEAIIDFNDFFV